MMEARHTLSKSERLYKKKLIDDLFNGDRSRAMSAFPLRMVYMPYDGENGGENRQMLISVPKRCFKRAVKRNRVKRQVREAYRQNKSIVEGLGYAVAFIWLDDKLHDTPSVEKTVVNLLTRLKEKMS